MLDHDSSKVDNKNNTYDALSKPKERVQLQKESLEVENQPLLKKKHCKPQRKQNQKPNIDDKQNYLMWVRAEDYIKDKITGVYLVNVRRENTQKSKA